MKLKLPIIIITLLTITAGCKENNIREIPKETKKRIITTYYKPIYDNANWICGNEIPESYEGALLPDTAYYDEFNNMLLSISKDNSIVKKNTFYSPPENKLQEEFTIYFNKSNSSKIVEKTEFIRNNKGLLIQKKGKENTFFIYDSDDFRTQELDESKKVITSYQKVPAEVGHETIIKKTFDSYGNINEQHTYITNKTKNIIEREIIEFKSGSEEVNDDFIYHYDNSNRVIRKDCIRIQSNGTTIKGFSELEYNEHGDITSNKIFEQNSNGIYQLAPLSHMYQYEYNKNGDWVKRITFYTSAINGEFNASFITIREIKLLNQ